MKLIAALSASSLFVLATLGGCSSDDTSNPSTPDGGGPNPIVNADGGPDIGTQPLDGHAIWTKSTNIAHYKVYKSRDEAIAWFNGAQDRGDNGIATDKAVASSDARYADIDKKVAEIWAGYQALFPQDTQDLPTPIVILVDSPHPGAYAVFDPELGLSPNVFMVQTPTLPLGDVAIRGVIAHELAHHVLKHKWPGVSDKLERWYDATKTISDGLGFQQKDDATIKTDGKTAQIYGQSTGDYPQAQWNGFTRPGGTLDDFVGYIHDKAKATNATPCGDADTARDALLQFGDPLRDRATNSFNASADQLTQLDTLSKAYVAKETTCTGVVTGKFFAVIGEALGITEADARASASQAEIDANDSATSAYDALVRLTTKYDAFMVSKDFKNTRYYSYEEQADDTSVAVLDALSLDTSGMKEFLSKGVLDDAGRAKCTSFGANEPTYGIISDAHHSNCWRIWHLDKFTAAYLKK